MHAVVLHVFPKQKGVIPLFLGLNHIVVGVAIQIQRVVVVGHIQIQIGTVKFFVDLVVEQVNDFLI
jgi:hypothetical protein